MLQEQGPAGTASALAPMLPSCEEMPVVACTTRVQNARSPTLFPLHEQVSVTGTAVGHALFWRLTIRWRHGTWSWDLSLPLITHLKQWKHGKRTQQENSEERIPAKGYFAGVHIVNPAILGTSAPMLLRDVIV
jgi:hypothetical protein